MKETIEKKERGCVFSNAYSNFLCGLGSFLAAFIKESKGIRFTLRERCDSQVSQRELLSLTSFCAGYRSL